MLAVAGGTSIIKCLLEQIAAAGIAEVVISANDFVPYVELNPPAIADRHTGIGPLGGIEAVLAELALRCDCVLLLPCDLPNITAQEILRLVRSYEEAPGRVAVAHTTEDDHPLCAVVPVTVLGDVRAAIAAGSYGVGRLWRSLGARRVEIADDSRMINLNTPDDLRAWRDL